MSTINPTPAFPSYPLVGYPENGSVVDADVNKSFIDDIHNRCLYLKNKADDNLGKLINTETQTGLDIASSDLPLWVSGSQPLTGKTVKEAIEILNSYFSQIDAIISNLGTNIGGNVETSSPLNYSSTFEVTNGDSHHSAIEKLDTGINEAKTSIFSVSPTIALNQTKIDNVANKISSTASSTGIGLGYTSHNFLTDGLMADAAISALDKPILTNRRINEYNHQNNVLAWRDSAFGESGGATPDAYFYESLYNSSKLSATNSTPNSYDNINQSFGRDDTGWTYYSNIQALLTGTNRLKIKFSGLGVISVSCNFQGSFSTGFINLPQEDMWVSIPAGTQLVIKVVGGSGSKLFSYQTLWKTI